MLLFGSTFDQNQSWTLPVAAAVPVDLQVHQILLQAFHRNLPKKQNKHLSVISKIIIITKIDKRIQYLLLSLLLSPKASIRISITNS